MDSLKPWIVSLGFCLGVLFLTQGSSAQISNNSLSCPHLVNRLAQSISESQNIKQSRLSSLGGSGDLLDPFPHNSMPFQLTSLMPATKLHDELKLVDGIQWPMIRFQDPLHKINLNSRAAPQFPGAHSTNPTKEILLDVPDDWVLRDAAKASDLGYHLKISRDLEHSKLVLDPRVPDKVMMVPNSPKVEAFPATSGGDWFAANKKIDDLVMSDYLKKGILTLDEIKELRGSTAQSIVPPKMIRFEMRDKSTQELVGTLGLNDGSRSPGLTIAPSTVFDGKQIASTNPIQTEALFPSLNLRSKHPDAFELVRYAVPSPDIRVHRVLHAETSQYLIRKYGYNMQILDKIPIYDLTVKADPKLLTRAVEKGGFGFTQVKTPEPLKLKSGKELYLFSTSALNYVRAVNQMLSPNMSKADIAMWDEAVKELGQGSALTGFPVGR